MNDSCEGSGKNNRGSEGVLRVSLGFLGGTVVKKRKKNPSANAGDTGDVDSVPGSGRSSG